MVKVSFLLQVVYGKSGRAKISKAGSTDVALHPFSIRSSVESTFLIDEFDPIVGRVMVFALSIRAF